ncbi:transcriptional regulator [Actinopolymorpha cephalotaxi]|uniref:Transcriptional regulator n=1 Tax=Actinopolymorpha cephalotaxi TaxID=504797 RepID=A0A1I2KGC5_9ACTN|nr:FMN-binding negative transcriptional regulator [Actinopolymorpha cephalotaxi]NYH84394.1 transcriptional regulator [Actinopolymorpha cephalotaxi]SFF63996.1 transcriptional regulator [Actinopolymorpha cephalotaxi]
MLIHPWDEADEDEWRGFLAEHDFGQLVAGGRDRDLPVVVPTHFLFDGDRTVWLHLARPNPVWAPLAEHPRAVLTVVDDYVYSPARWQAPPGTPVEHGVPTSFYATVQLACDVRVVDDPEEKATALNRQLDHFEPGSGRVPVPTEADRRLLSGLRVLELTVTGVRAKFKYAGNKEAEHREEIAAGLAARGGRSDDRARAHLLRRLEQSAGPAAQR